MPEQGSHPLVVAVTEGQREEQPEGLDPTESYGILQDVHQEGVWDELAAGVHDLGDPLWSILETDDLSEGLRLGFGYPTYGRDGVDRIIMGRSRYKNGNCKESQEEVVGRDDQF